MPSASTSFTVGSPQQMSQPSVAPSVDYGGVNTNANLNYPTYVPVTVPAPIPSKEAAITNVSMPQQVLPGAAFSIIVTVSTYVAGTINYTVNLQIPQLQLQQTSIPMTLSNNSVGTTTFNVSLPITARGLTANGVVTGQLSLQDTTNNQTVDGVPLQFSIAGASIPTPVGVVPNPIQPIPLGPVGIPVIGSVPYGPGAIRHAYQGGYRNIRIFPHSGIQSSQGRLVRDRYSNQGYVFGRSGGQRHQWDFMPHSLERYSYQGVLGVDYNLACSDQSTANGAGMCANGTRAVVSPISQAPPPPSTVPVPATSPPVLVPTSTDTGIPSSPSVIPATPTVPITPPVPVPTVSTPVPVVTPSPTPIPIHPDNDRPNLPPRPTSNTPEAWRNWAQQFRRELGHGQGHGQRGERWGRNSGWSFHRGGHSYQATVVQPTESGSTTRGPQSVIMLTTLMPDGTLHIDAHGLAPLEKVSVDLNIPLSNISRTTPLVADMSGHLAHDYRLTKPNPNKSYIAAIRVTGQSSQKVGFKSIKI